MRSLVIILLLALLSIAFACDTYDVCGVCNGDGTSCDTTPTTTQSNLIVNQKTYCAIDQSGEQEIDNPIFSVRAIASKIDGTASSFSFGCNSVDALSRIEANQTMSDATVNGETGQFVLYETHVALKDIYLCQDAVSNNGILTVMFPVMLANSVETSNETMYSNACNYIISRNETDSTYTTSYQTQRLGFSSQLKSFAWNEDDTLVTVFETTISAIDSKHPFFELHLCNR